MLVVWFLNKGKSPFLPNGKSINTVKEIKLWLCQGSFFASYSRKSERHLWNSWPHETRLILEQRPKSLFLFQFGFSTLPFEFLQNSYLTAIIPVKLRFPAYGKCAVEVSHACQSTRASLHTLKCLGVFRLSLLFMKTFLAVNSSEERWRTNWGGGGWRKNTVWSPPIQLHCMWGIKTGYGQNVLSNASSLG